MQTKFRPDFFVIGAMKCGTTSFANALRAHPQIFVPYEKSLNYFSVGLCPVLEPGLHPLKTRAVRMPHQYQKAFCGALPGQKRGDFSETSYFVAGTAARIAKTCPNAKIILLTRCPVARAYSSFNHALGHAMEPCPNFEQAFFRVETADTPPMLRYRSLGMFYRLLKPYLENFPREQIQIIRLEDLQHSPQNVLHNIQEFLSVAPRKISLPISNRAHVPAGIFASPQFRYFFKLLRPPVSHLAKNKLMRRITREVQQSIFCHPAPLSKSVVKNLSKVFAEDQESLYRFTYPPVSTIGDNRCSLFERRETTFCELRHTGGCK